MQTSPQHLTKKDANMNGLESHESGGQASSSVKRIEEETPLQSSADITSNKSRYVFRFVLLHSIFLRRNTEIFFLFYL